MSASLSAATDDPTSPPRWEQKRMLCDRPSADIGPAKPAPFNSAVVPPVQLGLNPPKKVNVYSTQNKPKGARNPSRQTKTSARADPGATAQLRGVCSSRPVCAA